MRLWVAVYLPHLALEAYFPRHLPDPCCAILEGQHVIAMSDSARREGVRHGMGRGGVLMLAPHTVILERDIVREEDCLDAIAMALLQYTPEVTHFEESVLLMNVGASLTLFGGVRRLCSRISADIRALGFTGRISCAPTARGAWVLARGAGPPRTLKMPTLQRRLEPVPVSVLPPARRFSVWLDGIGCTTVGELRRLPRPGLQRRCGRELLEVLDAAYGLSTELHNWIEPPEVFRARIEIFDRVEKADELLAGGHRLILQMLGWLTARQLAVRTIVLEMIHERGRVARPPSSLEITLADPVWRDDHLVRLLKERLGRQVLEAPVIGLVLEATDVVPMAPPSESLFPDPGGSEEGQQQLLEVLVARLGAENVLRPDPKADYRPEIANTWASISTPVRPGQLEAALPPDVDQFIRPTWILAKPIPLLMREDRPYYSSPLKIVSKPERIEAGWWSTSQSRDYFIAEADDKVFYWIYRERVVTEGGAVEPRWFLHGMFG